MRDYIQAQRNHYPELEEASETLGGALVHPLSVSEPLRQRLKDAWGVEVRVVEPEVLEDASQHYDSQRRILMLSSLLRPENRTFGIAYQLALLEFAPMIATHAGSRPAARSRKPAAAPHELRQLCGRGDHDALWQVPRARRRSIAMPSTG